MEINKFKESDDVSELLSGFKIAEYILQNVKNENIPKKYEQDLSNANFDDLVEKS